jgi:hypothetical protein
MTHETDRLAALDELKALDKRQSIDSDTPFLDCLDTITTYHSWFWKNIKAIRAALQQPVTMDTCKIYERGFRAGVFSQRIINCARQPGSGRAIVDTRGMSVGEKLAYAKLQQPSVPAGWKLVPIEPTRNQLDEMGKGKVDPTSKQELFRLLKEYDLGVYALSEPYKRAIAAAPTYDAGNV